jgi:hypothetical protein
VPGADAGEHDVVARAVDRNRHGGVGQVFLGFGLQPELAGLLVELCRLGLQFSFFYPSLADLSFGSGMLALAS